MSVCTKNCTFGPVVIARYKTTWILQFLGQKWHKKRAIVMHFFIRILLSIKWVYKKTHSLPYYKREKIILKPGGIQVQLFFMEYTR